ncbi:MAG TPA: hypothetical protein PK185_16870 [Cyclobacteriaceae bacterium]|nr:hypothetical protein [Cyclobacteriaceae bacterium]
MADKISSNTGDPISGETAKRWIATYKERHPAPDEKIACFYGSAIFNQILAQPGCIGIRIYFAYDDNDAQQKVLVGVDAVGNNIWDLNATEPGEGGLVADYGTWCPPYCPPEK